MKIYIVVSTETRGEGRDAETVPKVHAARINRGDALIYLDDSKIYRGEVQEVELDKEGQK
jgi:hypothetical protein